LIVGLSFCTWIWLDGCLEEYIAIANNIEACIWVNNQGNSWEYMDICLHGPQIILCYHSQEIEDNCVGFFNMIGHWLFDWELKEGRILQS
jgi:hypothetical protein